MFIYKILLAWTAGFSLIMSTQASSPLQTAFKNTQHEQGNYSIFSSPSVNGYTIRAIQPKTCEPSVQYSGYVDKHDTDDHFFFYFVESRSDPKNDPTVLWLNGGPGCSSMMGSWMEIGPCRVNDYGNDTTRNPFSWNTAANFIFLDQPVGAGYSYGKSKTRSSKEASKNVYAFLQLFFQKFPQYAVNDFHISGESYSGHYIPAVSTRIIRNNKEAKAKNLLTIPFKSILIGNGWTSPRAQFKEYSTFGCLNDSNYKPIFDNETCEHMANTYSRCKQLINVCYKMPSTLTCFPSSTYCQRLQTVAFDKTGLNPFDIRKKCDRNFKSCYKSMDYVQQYANREDVRLSMGVDPEFKLYETCKISIQQGFIETGDNSKDFGPNIAEALDSGVSVFLFVGDADWLCNWVGNLAWTLEMEWSGKEGYNAETFKEWYSDLTGKHAGDIRSFGNLTFLKVFNAGHMVPYDQPEIALEFVTKWFRQIPLVD